MANIHLISSPSYHIINKLIKDISGDNENITIESLMDMSIYDCIDDASYAGLFDGDRVIVIKDVKYFGGSSKYEDESKAIIKFLSNLDESLKIIFICDSISKTKDLTKKVIELGAILHNYEELDTDTINNTISEYTKENDILIDNNARDEIIKNSLNDLDIALNDIDKISIINKHITIDLVREYGIKLEDIDNYEFSNAVVAKDFNKAFEVLDKLLANEVEVISLLGLLASSYANMYMVRDAANHGLSDEEIVKKLGYSSTRRVFALKQTAKIYTTEELESIIISLSELDVKLKNGNKATSVYDFKEFLINL